MSDPIQENVVDKHLHLSCGHPTGRSLPPPVAAYLPIHQNDCYGDAHDADDDGRQGF